MADFHSLLLVLGAGDWGQVTRTRLAFICSTNCGGTESLPTTVTDWIRAGSPVRSDDRVSPPMITAAVSAGSSSARSQYSTEKKSLSR